MMTASPAKMSKKMFKAFADRGKELIWNLGVQVLLPRLFLYSFIPVTLLGIHSKDSWSFWWFPDTMWMFTFFFCCFLLNVWADIAVSRYLRLHQDDSSPYEYTEACDSFTNKYYFRIAVRDKSSFRSLIKSLRVEHKGEAVSRWLWLDDLMFVPGVLFLLFGLLLYGASWFAWQLFHPLGFWRELRSQIRFWREITFQS